MVATAPAAKPLTLHVSDTSGQHTYRARGVSPDSTVGETITSLLSRMGLLDKVDGKPLPYSLRLDRESRQLHASERAGDALREADRVTLTPSIDAG